VRAGYLNIKSEQQDQVESTPHWSRRWEAGNQVMLQANCKGKGQSKKLSKKWTGPYTTVEVRSPQVVVKELNSRNWFTINFKWIKPFNAATLTTLNSSSNNGHYEVKEVLQEHTTDTDRHEYKVKCTLTATTAGLWKRTFMQTVYLSSSKQVGTQQPQVECRTPRMVLRLVGGGVLSQGIPIPHSGEMYCAPFLINGSLPSSLACGLTSPVFTSPIFTRYWRVARKSERHPTF